MKKLPVINITPLYDVSHPEYAKVCHQIDQACREWGFFYISGYKANQLPYVYDLAKQFFSKPLLEKLQLDIQKNKNTHRGYGALGVEQLNPDLPEDFKEIFDMGVHLDHNHPDVVNQEPLRGPNVYPNIENWETVMQGYFDEMLELAKVLLNAMSHAIGLPQNYFEHCLKDSLCFFRLIHYPPTLDNTDKASFNAGTHTDYGCVTILAQDEIGGLQVQDVHGQWIDAPPIPDTYVINIGDMMARWSNDTYKSTPHRVSSPKGKQRFSFPFFIQPSPHTVIQCLPNCFSHSNPAKYSPITSMEYLQSRFSATYKHRADV
ncbi:isopenicillin N synthase family dioxygenase [Acinetobacter sp. HZNU-JH01]|uniref:isopenicillin N synthase family dioxygenase n=1 Tax=Acinetobacter sp. HZNU-JH01 TaxID=3136280 RepID=UPI0030F41218